MQPYVTDHHHSLAGVPIGGLEISIASVHLTCWLVLLVAKSLGILAASGFAATKTASTTGSGTGAPNTFLFACVAAFVLL